MPLYEFLCPKCGSQQEVFTRSFTADVQTPKCPDAGRQEGHEMRRIVSKFAQHKTVVDQLAEAEAKWGKEVDAAMGPEPDVGRMAKRYERLAADLPE
ncbi:MAG: zinc ribbon domain-containing protein [Dehalococcoidia bacterium]